MIWRGPISRIPQSTEAYHCAKFHGCYSSLNNFAPFSWTSTPSVSGTTSSTSTASPEFASFQRFLASELQSFKEDLKRQNDESINDAVKRMRFEQSSR